MVVRSEVEENGFSELVVGQEILRGSEAQKFLEMVGALGFAKYMPVFHTPGIIPNTLAILQESTKENPNTLMTRLKKSLQILGIVQSNKVDQTYVLNSQDWTVTEKASYLQPALQEAMGMLKKAGFIDPKRQESVDEVYGALLGLGQFPNGSSQNRLQPPSPVLALLRISRLKKDIFTRGDVNIEGGDIAAPVTISKAFEVLIPHEKGDLAIIEPLARRSTYQLSPFGHVLVDRVLPMFAQRARAVAAA